MAASYGPSDVRVYIYTSLMDIVYLLNSLFFYRISGEEDCKKTIKGLDYRGKISTTPSGRTCQRWDSQSPHKHSGYADNLPGGAGAHENYCRNPKNHWETKPWCYTTDPRRRWEYCDIPFCGKYRNHGCSLSLSLSTTRQLLCYDNANLSVLRIL